MGFRFLFVLIVLFWLSVGLTGILYFYSTRGWAKVYVGADGPPCYGFSLGDSVLYVGSHSVFRVGIEDGVVSSSWRLRGFDVVDGSWGGAAMPSADGAVGTLVDFCSSTASLDP